MKEIVYSNAPGLGAQGWSGWTGQDWDPGISPWLVWNGFGYDIVPIYDAQLLVVQTGPLAGYLVRLIGDNTLSVTGDFNADKPVPLTGTITGFQIFDRYEALLSFDDANNRIVTNTGALWNGVMLAAGQGFSIDAATIAAAADPGAALWAAFAGGAEMYRGGRGADAIDAGSGNDTIRAAGGKDTVWGGAGNDVIDARSGSDEVYGGKGLDTISGGTGNDRIYGGDDIDRIEGGDGRDRLFGDAGDDRLFGDAGDDSLRGGDGADRLYGGDDHDWIAGGAGNDLLAGGKGNDTLLGGMGRDRFQFYKGDGQDRIEGYVQGEDILQLQTALWGGAALSRQDVITQFGTMTAGGDFALVFAGGESVTLVGVTSGAVLLDGLAFL